MSYYTIKVSCNRFSFCFMLSMILINSMIVINLSTNYLFEFLYIVFMCFYTVWFSFTFFFYQLPFYQTLSKIFIHKNQTRLKIFVEPDLRMGKMSRRYPPSNMNRRARSESPYAKCATGSVGGSVHPEEFISFQVNITNNIYFALRFGLVNLIITCFRIKFVLCAKES